MTIPRTPKYPKSILKAPPLPSENQHFARFLQKSVFFLRPSKMPRCRCRTFAPSIRKDSAAALMEYRYKKGSFDFDRLSILLRLKALYDVLEAT